jgi:putative nucleotidyltransferase with HDIG domain
MIASIMQSHNDLIKAYDSTLLGWSRATDLRDSETQQHSLQVTKLAVQLARKMRIPEKDLINIYRGALLHDVGKIGVPDFILRKPGRLTEPEWVEMRKHPQYAFEMLAQIEYLRPAIDIPYCHHEKWDGSGYPRGLKGEEIPLAARIFAVADVWNAMISERVYRAALPQQEVLSYLVENRGAHFDPQVVDAFIEMVSSK